MVGCWAIFSGLVGALLAGNPAAEFNAGLAAEARGDRPTATALYQQALLEAPTWGLPRLQLADLLLQGGEGADQALALLAPLSGPAGSELQNPRLHHLLALALAAKGQAPAAEAEERQALALRPEYRAAAQTLAEALWSEHKVDEALAGWRSLAARHPEDTALRALLVDRLLDAARTIEAEKELRKLAADQPSNPVWHRRLARTLDLEGLPTEAERERAVASKLSGVSSPKRHLRRLPDSKR